jgi:hypothetical protein
MANAGQFEVFGGTAKKAPANGGGELWTDDAAEVDLRDDRFLDGVRIYSERDLVRKIKKEMQRLPNVGPDDLPDEVTEYLIDRHIESVIRGVALSGLQTSVYTMHLRGFTVNDIARQLRVSRQRVSSVILQVKRAVAARRNDKYAGLYEVYWREVNRYIYRKPRLDWG